MHLQAGNLAAAEECYQRSVDITPRMAKQFIEVRDTIAFAWSNCPFLQPQISTRQAGMLG
jgi:hypothetical protein